jgi:hypothetical protein
MAVKLGEESPHAKRSACWLCRGRGGARTFGVRRSAFHEPIATAVARNSQKELLQGFVDAQTHGGIRDLGSRLNLPPLAIFAFTPF